MKLLNKKKTKQKRDHIEKRLHNKRIYMEIKYIWKKNYIGKKLHLK